MARVSKRATTIKQVHRCTLQAGTRKKIECQGRLHANADQRRQSGRNETPNVLRLAAMETEQCRGSNGSCNVGLHAGAWWKTEKLENAHVFCLRGAIGGKPEEKADKRKKEGRRSTQDDRQTDRGPTRPAAVTQDQGAATRHRHQHKPHNRRKTRRLAPTLTRWLSLKNKIYSRPQESSFGLQPALQHTLQPANRRPRARRRPSRCCRRAPPCSTSRAGRHPRKMRQGARMVPRRRPRPPAAAAAAAPAAQAAPCHTPAEEQAKIVAAVGRVCPQPSLADGGRVLTGRRPTTLFSRVRFSGQRPLELLTSVCIFVSGKAQI